MRTAYTIVRRRGKMLEAQAAFGSKSYYKTFEGYNRFGDPCYSNWCDEDGYDAPSEELEELKEALHLFENEVNRIRAVNKIKYSFQNPIRAPIQKSITAFLNWLLT